jgi:hypothetical protein
VAESSWEWFGYSKKPIIYIYIGLDHPQGLVLRDGSATPILHKRVAGNFFFFFLKKKFSHLVLKFLFLIIYMDTCQFFRGADMTFHEIMDES